MNWQQNSEWQLSAKGNYWRKLNSVVIVVGQKKDSDEFWALVDGKFLAEKYGSLQEAQAAAEAGVK
jgi:hypothetical protein